jgi:hypothetical protein
MFSNGTTGSVEGGALRRRARQSGSDRASQSSPLQDPRRPPIVVFVELDHLTSNECSLQF